MSGTVPLAAALPWGRAGRTCCLSVPGTGGVGMGDPDWPDSMHSCESLWGWQEGFPGGGALRRCEGQMRSGARPPPAGRPRGGLSGSAADVLWAHFCGLGGLALSLWLACPAGGCVPPGWWVAIPGGWPPTVLRGVCCQALSLFRPPVPGGGQPGPVARVSRARVVWAWGTQHQPHSVRSCEPALRAVGGGGRASPGGVPWAAVRGV